MVRRYEESQRKKNKQDVLEESNVSQLKKVRLYKKAFDYHKIMLLSLVEWNCQW